MTYLDLKNKVRRQIWVDGEGENLIAVHDSFFLEALYDLQVSVDCLSFNNLSVFPSCATYFNCGFTVLPKPEGQVVRLYVIDRINPETGAEDPAAIPDWCSKVYYHPVQYCSLLGYKKLCERCGGSGIIAVAEAIASAFFGIFRRKRFYPRPTDEGMESLPTLPEGFHYPQSSTDAGGRSPSGVFAIYRGRIYIAPWIQSTETVVIESTGVKRNWADNDIVDDDPKFIQAVRLHVSMQHEQAFGDDPAKLQRIKDALYGNAIEAGIIPMLIHQCLEEVRTRQCAEVGAGPAAARGIGANSGSANLYYNDRQEYTASCPAGQTGASVTVVVDAGTVGSAISVADANARAFQQAAEDANNRLVCVDAEVTYYNTPQSYTAVCPAASEGTPAAVGTPVTVNIPANTYTSVVSQASADAAALAAATSQANALLTCTYWNAEQEYTAECISPATGTPVTITVAAHTFSSTISQADANALALASATNQANEELECDTPVPVYYNSPQQATQSISRQKVVAGGQICILTVTVTAVVPPGRFTSIVNEAHANAQAVVYANQYAMSVAESLFAQATNCLPIFRVVNVP
jgi:hypothetical protein